MPKKEKKVILFLMEGESDAVSFEGLLRDYYCKYDVKVHIMHYDITIKDFPEPSEILIKIKEAIDIFLSITKLLKKDILQVIHFVDTDGVFVPDSCVIKSCQEKVSYTEEQILAPNPDNIKRRNKCKANVLRKLCFVDKVYKDIPYQIYFLSRNLEHVLHNKIENLTNSEKARLSDSFDERFAHKTHDFITFISTSAFTIPGNYNETWNSIQQGTESLHRYSNIHLLFNNNDDGKTQPQEPASATTT